MLNIFSLDIINNEALQQELTLCKLKKMNSYVNIALICAALPVLGNGINMGYKMINADAYFYESLTVFLLSLLWKVLQMKFVKATPIIGVMHMINVALFVNLALRNLIPG